MSISSLNDYIKSSKQNINFSKTTSRVAVAGNNFSVFDLAGMPGAGTLAGSSTTQGIVPDDTITGYPPVNAFAAGATGYVSRLTYSSTVACRIQIFDRLFQSGAHTFNAADTLASQPSYAARVPNSDYKGLRIFIEAVTAFTGIPAITVTYTNQDGVTGRTTGSFNGWAAALTLGRMEPMPLQAGDTGVQKIESVTCTTATAGTFNVNVLRPLVEARVPSIAGGGTMDMLSTGLPQVFDNSALFMVIVPDSTATGVPFAQVEIASA